MKQFLTYPCSGPGELRHCPRLLYLFILELAQPGMSRYKISQDGDGTGSGELHGVQSAGVQALGQ